MGDDDKNTTSRNICGICNEKKTSEYSCPRCEVSYCSLECYKAERHMQCSESFYKDCVNEELASNYTQDESKAKMIDILKRLHNEDENDQFQDITEAFDNEEVDTDSEDDDGKLSLHDRVKNLNLDDADAIWNVLTNDEKNEFESMLNQGDVGSLIPQWEPWWMKSKCDKLIEEVNENDKCPTIKNCIPSLSAITTVKPSPSIEFNITNVLASYAFIMRYFNGEVDAVEFVTCLLDICANLQTSANFDYFNTAIESVVQRCLESQLIETDETSIEVMKHDTYLILKGPSKNNKSFYCKSALSHLHGILSEARIMNKSNETKNKGEFTKKFPEDTRKYLPDLDLKKVKMCIKKIEYYLSYVNENGINIISQII